MQFEWDPNKAALNEEKHGVSFREAMTTFDDPQLVIFDDPDHSTIEKRELLVGTSRRGRLLITSFTMREEAVRIISARRTNKKERLTYYEDHEKKNEPKNGSFR
jgi:uncharacterized DUF497 family protein